MTEIAVIGAGHWGPNLIRILEDPPRSRVRWVVDVDEARLEQVRARFPGVSLGRDAAAAFDDPAVDAVVVVTPTTTHYPLAKRALEAGKHVLVEKPITADPGEAAELTEIAARAGRVLMVAHVFLYNAAVRRVRQYLTEGALGRVVYISMVRTNLGPIRTDVNAAWDLASHDVSIASFWLGASPLAVSATGNSWINPGIEDAVFATLRYPDGVLVNLHVSWLSPRKCRDISVVGERRMLTFDDMSPFEPIRIYDKRVTDARVTPSYVDSFVTFRSSVRDGDIVIPKVEVRSPLETECHHFLDCVEGGASPLTDGALGTEVVRVLAAMDRSLRGGGREEAV